MSVTLSWEGRASGGARVAGVPRETLWRVDQPRARIPYTSRRALAPLSSVFTGDGGQSLHEAERTVGAPASLLARVMITSGAPSPWAKSCADRPTRSPEIEAQLQPHRTAQPSIAARIGRPYALIEPGQYEAVVVLQARFQQAEDMHARVAGFGAPLGTPRAEQMENLGIFSRRQFKRPR